MSNFQKNISTCRRKRGKTVQTVNFIEPFNPNIHDQATILFYLEGD